MQMILRQRIVITKEGAECSPGAPRHKLEGRKQQGGLRRSKRVGEKV